MCFRMTPRKNALVGKMMVVMTSLAVCMAGAGVGASKLPPPPFPALGSSDAEASTGAYAGAEPSPIAAEARSDDPFVAFLKSNGLSLEMPTETPHLEVAPDTEVGGGDRIKRTGGVLGPLLGNKLSYLTKGSNHIHFHNYHSPNKGCDKWSLWDFKKAILGKLLEAAKLIGGGVLALKGKLISLKGKLVEIKGRKLAEKGSDLSNFGKGIISKVIGHGTTGHSGPSAPAAPEEPSAPLSVHPSGGGYGQQAFPPHPAPPPQHYGGYGVPTGHGSGPTHPSGPGFDVAASLLDEFNKYGYDRNSEHRRGTIHAGLLVLQPLKRQSNPSLMPRSTGPGSGIGVSGPGPDMVSSASEQAEEHVHEPLHLSHLSFSNTPLVLAPEVMESLKTEVGAPIETGNAQRNTHAQQQGSLASPSENNEHWVAPPENMATHTKAVFPSRLLGASLTGHSASSPEHSPEGAMASVIAKLHGQSSYFARADSKRR